MQRNSWHKRWSSPTWTTATPSWPDSQPLNHEPAPLRLPQNSAARLIYNLPKFSHVTPLFHDLHWLPILARIRFKMMVLASKAVNGTAPSYLQTLFRWHAPASALRPSISVGRLVPPSLWANKARSVKLTPLCEVNVGLWIMIFIWKRNL